MNKLTRLLAVSALAVATLSAAAEPYDNTTSSNDRTPAPTNNTYNYNTYNYTPYNYNSTLQRSSFESERKSSFFEFGYMATDLDYVKESGHYGISMTFLPWKMAGRLYAGLNISPVNLNYGLVDEDYVSDVIMAGPAFGLYFSRGCGLFIPVDVACTLLFDSDSNTKYDWGVAVMPTLCLGKKAGLFVGAVFTTPFDTHGYDRKITTGFRAGLYF